MMKNTNPLIVLSATTMGIGIVGLWITLLYTAAGIWIYLSVAGATGLMALGLKNLKKNGLIHYISPESRDLLLNVTPLQYITTRTFSKKLRPFIACSFGFTQQEAADMVSHMSLPDQRLLLKRGLVHLLPTPLQRLLLPGDTPVEEMAIVESDSAQISPYSVAFGAISNRLSASLSNAMSRRFPTSSNELTVSECDEMTWIGWLIHPHSSAFVISTSILTAVVGVSSFHHIERWIKDFAVPVCVGMVCVFFFSGRRSILDFVLFLLFGGRRTKSSL